MLICPKDAAEVLNTLRLQVANVITSKFQSIRRLQFPAIHLSPTPTSPVVPEYDGTRFPCAFAMLIRELQNRT